MPIRASQTYAPGAVYYQFVCSTGDGEHDPTAAPDDRVRPAHACLHGTVWRLGDPAAPVPPLDYGCRCGIRYTSDPEGDAAKALPTAPTDPETDPKAPARRYLNERAPKWSQIADAADKAPPARAVTVSYEKAKDLGYTRDIARMSLDVRPPQVRAPLGTGPLSGVGKSGRALVERWRTGDLEAAAKLKRSYPQTYLRIRAEEGLQEAP